MTPRHSESVWIYLAYSFILLSYINVNILYIRLFLILASIFFMCFAICVGNVYIDSLIFNSVLIIINSTYSYFLIIKRLPIKMSALEERIYHKDFCRVMDRRTFRDFIRKGHLRTFSDGGQICHSGNKFSGPFYVALINPNYKICYFKKGRHIFELEENSWIGVVEFEMYEKEKKLAKLKSKEKGASSKQTSPITGFKRKPKVNVKWAVNIQVHERDLTENEFTDPIYQDEDEPCYVYEFPLGELEKLFKDKDEGVLWKNAIYSIWLGYTTKAIIKIDAKVIKKDIKRRRTMTERALSTRTLEERNFTINRNVAAEEEHKLQPLTSERNNLIEGERSEKIEDLDQVKIEIGSPVRQDK